MELNKRLLIIDDEVLVLKSLSEKFTHEGFSVQTARDGKEGITKALSDHPDIILLDIIMPVMDGLTMLRLLRQDSWGKDAEVIILTNLSSAEKAQSALEQKVSDYLVKTEWSIGDLVKKVKEKLGLV